MDESLQAQLLPLRQRIDQIDAEILDLLNKRAKTAQEVGEVKHAHHAEGPVLRPEREAQVIRQLQHLNRGPFPARPWPLSGQRSSRLVEVSSNH